MKEYFGILKKCPLFFGIDESNLCNLLDCLNAKVLSFMKNQVIIEEGTPAKYFGIVLSGSVSITKLDYFGNKSIISVIEPSDLFGESFACAETKAVSVSVVAQNDSEIMLIDCKRIIHSCSNSCEFHSRIIYNLLKILAEKNLMFNQKIEITSKRTTREKLMTFLSFQAAKNSSNSFYIPFDRQSLADYLEVDRSGLSCEIGKLRKEGIIESKRNYFKILELKK
ncbi:MAG: Crp/Fnr family transcriptional regulator [Acutalibacteraceae bacterium]|nr:Crp/Fnr family transcriptional regulator [Acutalibacteraceae bacterium]